MPKVGEEEIVAALGSGITNVYAAQIYVHGLRYTFTGRTPGLQLAAGGQPYSAIIGRDFLRHFRLTYDGRTGEVSLSNDWLCLRVILNRPRRPCLEGVLLSH